MKQTLKRKKIQKAEKKRAKEYRKLDRDAKNAQEAETSTANKAVPRPEPSAVEQEAPPRKKARLEQSPAPPPAKIAASSVAPIASASVPVAAAVGAAPTKPTKASKKEAREQVKAQRMHRALYARGDKTLLVGEGNLSFARALCRHLGDGEGVHATVFDSQAELQTKYSDASECQKEIEETGGTVLCGVDATRLNKVKEFKNFFRKIVWNFPHSGADEADDEKCTTEHQLLLLSFLESAVKCLDTQHASSAIHISLKVAEPYKSWKLVQTAQGVAGLQLHAAVKFAPSAWPDYSYRSTSGEKSSSQEEHTQNSKVYVFTLQKQQQSR